MTAGTLLIGDSRQILPTLDDGIAQALVTSPPYLEQRYYGESDDEIGHEKTLDAYVAAIADVLDAARPKLAPDGLAWVNIGDKANNSGGAGGDWGKGAGLRATRARGARTFRDRTYPDGSFLDVGGALAHELIRRGWRLRAEIVWDKTKTSRESLKHVRRPLVQHEKIYLLAPTNAPSLFFPSLLTDKGSIWRFPPGSTPKDVRHLAPYPDELARRCILPSTRPGDLVLDPFDGSGTTRRVATSLGRRAIGIDLYELDGAERGEASTPPAPEKPLRRARRTA